MSAPERAPVAPAIARSDFLALFTAVMLPMFLAAVEQTLLAAATPRIAADLGGLADTAWVSVGYLLATTVTAPLYGRLGDRFGRREVLLVALAIFIGGSLVCALAPGMRVLIAGRVLQGLGGGGLMVLSQALIGELVAPAQRPRYQGYFAAVFTIASVGGPVIGGLVVTHGEWRWLFWANLPLGLLAAWRVTRLPRAAPSPLRTAPYDPAGVLLFAACASSLLLWVSLAGHRFAVLSAPSAALAVAGLGSGALLAVQQRRHPFPFLPLDVVRLPGVGWICLSIIGFAGTMFGLVFLLPIYLQVGQKVSASAAGLQLLPLTLGMVVGATLNGRLSLRSGLSGVLPPFGLGAAALALAVLAMAPDSRMLITAATAVCGIGFGTVMPNAQLAVQVLAGRERLGAAAALLSLTRSVGAAMGTAAFGGLAFTLLQPPSAEAAGAVPLQLEGLDPAGVTHAFQLVFGALAMFAGAAATAAAKAPRIDLRSGRAA